jgi:hypothetical protein
MGTARSKEKKGIKNEGNRAWIFDIKNNPHAMEKARIGQEIMDTVGLPKRFKESDES